VLGLFAGVVGARQKRLKTYERALKNISKGPSFTLLAFHFNHLYRLVKIKTPL